MLYGKIYKIFENSNPDKIYIGSTIQPIKNRFYQHNQKNNNCRTQLLDLSNATYDIIKEYEICDRNHLYAYEQLWINKLKCVNKQNAMCFKMKKPSKKILLDNTIFNHLDDKIGRAESWYLRKDYLHNSNKNEDLRAFLIRIGKYNILQYL